MIIGPRRCRGAALDDGKRVEVRGCDFYTFRGGKVIRKDSY
jgi:ketosteroid isomerase-like protein